MNKYSITQDGELVGYIEAEDARDVADIAINRFGSGVFEVSLVRGEDDSVEWEDD